MKKAWVALGAAGALVTSAACMPDNTLGGSVSALFPLDVSRVDVLRNDAALQVSYYSNRGADVDLVARITIATEGLGLRTDKTLKINGEYTPNHERTSVIHLAGGEPVRVLPKVKSGDLYLNSGGEVGQLTRGNFSVSFEQGDAFGGGRTLYGTFRGSAQDAGFGEDGNQNGVDGGT